MKHLSFLLISFFVIYSAKAQVTEQDSLALVDFYNSTDGDNWRTNYNWKSSSPVSSWYGVSVSGGRVTGLEMMGNLVKGPFPASFGDLTGLKYISFIDNELSGSIPNSFGNLVNLEFLNLGANYLTGAIPGSFSNLTKLKQLQLYSTFLEGPLPSAIGDFPDLIVLDVQYSGLSGYIPTGLIREDMFLALNNNRYDFGSLEPFVQLVKEFKETHNGPEFYYQDQDSLPILRYQDGLYVNAGGSPDKTTYTWYKDGGAVSSALEDTLFIPTGPGTYYATVTNSVVDDLTLISKKITLGYEIINDSLKGSGVITSSNPSLNLSDGLNLLATITATGSDNKLSGEVTGLMVRDETVKTVGSFPYVQRHYDIEPADNAENATANVTLYFTQEDFDNYNDFITTSGMGLALLPTNKTDNGNIRVTQYHGAYTGTADPDGYSGSTTFINNPGVQWRDDLNAWAVTFPVNGFSGFFVSTVESALPLTLTSFDATAQKNVVALHWQTIAEINTHEFIVERSADNNFKPIGRVGAFATSGYHSYSFDDRQPQPGKNLYRLKMVDKDGRFTYSKTISVNITPSVSIIEAYPNPVSSVLRLKVLAGSQQKAAIKISNTTGAVVLQKDIHLQKGLNYSELNTNNLPAGIYYIHTVVDGVTQKTSFLKR
ncbi:MAG: T9SS type A sorting domain-containing protein [Chitinophagaceae bacterium]|nr:T9SS type A sorting domain-containing protein [Chitinophagaceae bacterium]